MYSKNIVLDRNAFHPRSNVLRMRSTNVRLRPDTSVSVRWRSSFRVPRSSYNFKFNFYLMRTMNCERCTGAMNVERRMSKDWRGTGNGARFLRGNSQSHDFDFFLICSISPVFIQSAWQYRYFPKLSLHLMVFCNVTLKIRLYINFSLIVTENTTVTVKVHPEFLICCRGRPTL